MKRYSVLSESRLRATCSVVAASVACGCLDVPPTYEPETQIPPFIVSSEVNPPIEAVYTLNLSERMQINVPFISEDLGEQLVGYVLVDAETNQVTPSPTAGPFTLGPSTLSDHSRAVNESFSLRLSNSELGCHTVTLVLTYVSNLSLGSPVDPLRTARIVWWVNVIDSSASTEMEALLTGCPTTGGG